MPSTGTYYFGGTHDDRIKITVNGTAVLDKWADNQTAYLPEYGTGVALTANTPVSIVVDYFNDTGRAFIGLWQYKSGGSATLLPPTWLKPDVYTTGALPDGWTFGGPLGGTAVYGSAIVTNDRVTFKTSWGGTVEFKRPTGGTEGWEPPEGDKTLTLTQAPNGELTLKSPFGTFGFDKDGRILTEYSASELAGGSMTAPDLNAPSYVWRTLTTGTPTVSHRRLDKIVDTIVGEETRYKYNDGTNCQTPSGVPWGMLCQIDRYNGTTTTKVKLEYNGGYLSRVTLPDTVSAVRDPHYDFFYTTGRLTDLRDPVASEVVEAGLRSDNDKVRWLIGYSGTPAKVSTITAPAPVADTDPRPARTYTYGAGYTEVKRAPETTYTRRVEWNTTTMRQTKELDAAGRATEYGYDTVGRLIQVDIPSGTATKLRSTTIYDTDGKVTDQWGPAPSTYFQANGTPGAGHSSADVPNVHTNYDENITSLATTWYQSTNLFQNPTATENGIGNTSGEIDTTWGAGKPANLTSADNWSGMITGWITFATAGDYYLKLKRGGLAAVFLDNERLSVEDAWKTPSLNDIDIPVTGVTAGARKRIMIWFADSGTGSANANLALRWKTPGSGTFVNVPAPSLNPGYGLPTSATDPDGKKVGYLYNNKANGIRTGTTADPDSGGLQITTTTEMNTANRLSKTIMPSGGNANTQYTYWGDTETPTGFSNPCGTTGVTQRGQAKTTNYPTPAAGSALTKDSVYNAQGQIAGTRSGSDPWSCYTYDDRGRPTQRTVPAYGGDPTGRTITFTYSISGNPLVSSVSDPAGTITTTVDLLGRTTQMVDVWNKTRTVEYDRQGRTTKTAGPEGTVETASNNTDQATQIKLDTLTVATITYDSSTGRPLNYTYPSGSGNGGNGTISKGLTSTGTAHNDLQYDNYGRPWGIAWYQPGGSTLITSDWTKARSISGKVTDRAIDGTDPRTGANYEYDNAGRLTKAWDGANAYEYQFNPTSGCGVNAGAGKNTNRTTQKVNGNADTYCYDHADRLTTVTPYGQSATTPAYDNHGNTTTFGLNTFTYDADNRHLSTVGTGVTIEYVRDAGNQVVARKKNGTTVARFSGSAVLDATNAVVSRTIGLPGGVIINKKTGGDTYTYPNTGGHATAEVNASGIKVGNTNIYDPYGNRITGQKIANLTTDFNIGWSGIQPTETEAGLWTERIEMGARQYLPALGRFLSQDPIGGGSANAYEYGAGDPVNGSDYSGLFWTLGPFPKGLFRLVIWGNLVAENWVDFKLASPIQIGFPGDAYSDDFGLEVTRMGYTRMSQNFYVTEDRSLWATEYSEVASVYWEIHFWPRDWEFWSHDKASVDALVNHPLLKNVITKTQERFLRYQNNSGPTGYRTFYRGMEIDPWTFWILSIWAGSTYYQW